MTNNFPTKAEADAEAKRLNRRMFGTGIRFQVLPAGDGFKVEGFTPPLATEVACYMNHR